MGLNTLCMYSFWNMHEPKPGRCSIFPAISISRPSYGLAQEEGLWVIVRPGPYSCAEWEFGGFPSWLLRSQHKGAQGGPRFSKPAERYMNRLMAEVAPLQISAAGRLS